MYLYKSNRCIWWIDIRSIHARLVWWTHDQNDAWSNGSIRSYRKQSHSAIGIRASGQCCFGNKYLPGETLFCYFQYEEHLWFIYQASVVSMCCIGINWSGAGTFFLRHTFFVTPSPSNYDHPLLLSLLSIRPHSLHIYQVQIRASLDKDDNVTMLEVILRTDEGDIIVRDTGARDCISSVCANTLFNSPTTSPQLRA